MTARTFVVRTLWDDEAKVYYSESDIEGLHIEASTIEEFGQILMELGPALALANHIDRPDQRDRPLADLVPAILWEKPAVAAA
jgi:hypothetical protein